MAKKSIVNKNERTLALIKKYRDKRHSLVLNLVDGAFDNEELFKIMKVLDRTHRASSIRYRNRCKITGRPRGYRGGVGLSRVALRHYASFGLIVGLKKS